MYEDEQLYDTYEFPEPGEPQELVDAVARAVEEVDGYRIGKTLGYGTHDGDSYGRVEVKERPSSLTGKERLFRWRYEFMVDVPLDGDEAATFEIRYRDSQSIWYDDVDREAVDELVEAVRDTAFFTT